VALWRQVAASVAR